MSEIKTCLFITLLIKYKHIFLKFVIENLQKEFINLCVL